MTKARRCMPCLQVVNLFWSTQQLQREDTTLLTVVICFSNNIILPHRIELGIGVVQQVIQYVFVWNYDPVANICLFFARKTETVYASAHIYTSNTY